MTQEYIRGNVAVIEQSFRSSREFIISNAGGAAFERKDDGSPVTAVDIAVEKNVKSLMSEHFPDMLVYGEESGYSDQLPDVCWLIDPLDGTKSYIKNIPAYTCMAVFIVAGVARASVIYNPTTDEIFTALAGNGAYKNDVRLDLKNSTLPKEVFCKTQDRVTLQELLTEFGIQAHVAASGAGYGMSQVADSKAAARFHLHSGRHIHDHAPGALLIREAGGDVIPIFEDDYTVQTRSFVACHPGLSDLVRNNIDLLRNLEDPDQALS
jgi:myo-inositol-1(or 4)-monophosphatase